LQFSLVLHRQCITPWIAQNDFIKKNIIQESGQKIITKNRLLWIKGPRPTYRNYLGGRPNFSWFHWLILKCRVMISANIPRRLYLPHNQDLSVGSSISPIYTFVYIPALLLKNTLRFLIRAGIFTKVWIGDIQ
jgi:hypothetical protein